MPSSSEFPGTKEISSTSELNAILLAFYSGGRYGIKIRFPHAFIMTFLFKRHLSTINKLRSILKATLEHALNLACFAGLYKSILALLKHLCCVWIERYGSSNENKKYLFMIFMNTLKFVVFGPFHKGEGVTEKCAPGFPQSTYHSFVAGMIGGYTIWGRYSSINYQVVLYLCSRILIGAVMYARKIGFMRSTYFTFPVVYPAFASLVWGTVMFFFEYHPDVLHPSLKNSMDEIYRISLNSQRKFKN